MVRVVVIVLCGCNAVFDLDLTELAEPRDHDGDGITNDDDNCPVSANPVQEDADSDAVGDACDPCVDGEQLYVDADLDGVDDGCDPCARGPGIHDEDGDQLIDACDNCPGASNADQQNVDGDEVGDACDPSAAIQHRRVVFAGFDVLPPEWVPASNVDWVISNDTVGPVAPPSPPGPHSGLWDRSHLVGGRAWSIEIGAVIPSQFPNFTYGVGVAFRRRFGIGQAVAWCDLDWNQSMGTWVIANNNALAPVSVTPGLIRLRMRQSASLDVACELGGTMITYSVAEEPVTPTIYTSANLAELTYVDVLEGVP